MANKKEEKITEESILFPEVKVGDMTVVPWSFGKLFEVSSALEKVIDKSDKKGLTKILETDGLTTLTIARLFTIASPEVLEVISITTGKDIEEIKGLSMEDGIQVAMTIFNQNKETIKNALAPLFQPIKK